MNKNFKPVLFVAILTLSNAVSAQAPAAPAAPAAKPQVAAPAAAPAAPAAPVAAPAPAPAPAPVAAPAAPAAPAAAPAPAPAAAAMPAEAPVAAPAPEAPAPVAAPEPAPAPIAAPVVISEAPAVAEAAPAPAPAGMFGLTIGFSGSQPTIGLAYATAVWKVTLDLGFDRDILKDNKTGPDKQTISIVPGFSHDIGKCLLPFGLGVVGGINLKDEGSDTGNLDWWVMPNFYTKAWLVDKVSFGVSAGPRIENGGTKDLHVFLTAGGKLTFYFL